MAYCPQCGVQVSDSANLCGDCGTMFRASGWQPLTAPPVARSRELPIAVRPASIYRRWLSALLDIALLGVVLVVVAQVLPEGPPPADAMAFFSKQDFANYFFLVGLAALLAAASVALVAIPKMRATPGQYALGLKLVAFSGAPPTRRQVAIRSAWAAARVVIIMVPGPIIALFIGSFASLVLHLPFSTTDRLLVQAGLPTAVRYGLHSLSFIALAAAVWMLLIHPWIKHRDSTSGVLTLADRLSGTTHVRLAE